MCWKEIFSLCFKWKDLVNVLKYYYNSINFGTEARNITKSQNQICENFVFGSNDEYY